MEGTTKMYTLHEAEHSAFENNNYGLDDNILLRCVTMHAGTVSGYFEGLPAYSTARQNALY